MQCSNYTYNLPDEDLIRLKHVVDETTTIQDNAADHQPTNTTKDCTSNTATEN
jgi:hypothetical protein